MYPIDLSGKNGIILGVANERSIAWAIAEILGQAGSRLALTYQDYAILGRGCPGLGVIQAIQLTDRTRCRRRDTRNSAARSNIDGGLDSCIR